MTPYEQLVSATNRLHALKGMNAPCDIGVTFRWRRGIIVAKGEPVDAEAFAALAALWDHLAYSYFQD